MGKKRKFTKVSIAAFWRRQMEQVKKEELCNGQRS
jgi:hypothetical protein